MGVCNCSMFFVRYFMSILVLQSSWWGRESWLLCLICPPGVSWWLGGSSSRCRGVVCGLWLWYFLIILTYYFYGIITEPVFTDDKVYNVGSLLFQITKRYERVAYNMDIMKQYAYLVMNPITLYSYGTTLLYVTLCPFWYCNHLDGEERAGCFA